MAGSFIGGAALGAVFGELLKAVLQECRTTLEFGSNLDRLKTTMVSISPVFDEIEKLNQQLDNRREETQMLIQRLQEGQELVRKCSTIGTWSLYKKYKYSRKLLRLENSMLRFFQFEVPLQSCRDIKRILVGVNGLDEKIDGLDEKIDEFLAIQKNGGGGSIGFPGSCAVPGLPDRIVGLDKPLQELKMMMLKDDTSLVVLSASGGCGKTTLAKMFCRDEQIEGIYGNRIFFVNVSQKPDLRAIVQKLFQHMSFHMHEFHSDEDAINQLENFLRQMGSKPILLVLDDVWSTSEFLEKFRFRIPRYKILVTSRNEFLEFNSTYKLKLLNDDDAMTLFRRWAFPQNGSSHVPNDLVKEVVKSCRGFPLALTVVGRSLRGKDEVVWKSRVKKWSEGVSIFDSNNDLLVHLQTSLDALDEMDTVKECYLDLGSFPEDQRIPASVLQDMWVEMYDLDEDGLYTLENLLELSTRNLVNFAIARKDESGVDDYCNGQFVTQHDLLRELAIRQSNQGPIEQRKRLIIDMSKNNLSKGWIEEMQQPIHARLLSISTDEPFIASRSSMQLPEVETLILNLQMSNFDLPLFIEGMGRLKVLIITNYGFSATKLNHLSLVGYLSNLRRIRLEHVSISSLDISMLQLRNLRKISLIMCEIGQAFENCTIEVLDIWPNLLEIDVEYCDDLVEFPMCLCNIVHLKKLSITYCHELVILSERFGNLKNLEVLKLHSCTKLSELPVSIGGLEKLRFLDISDCVNLSKLPMQMGKLCSLRRLNMRGCLGIHELPQTVMDLRRLEDVICDEEMSYLWEDYRFCLNNLKTLVLKEDINLNWLHKKP